MQIIDDRLDLEAYFVELGKSRQSLLLLDYDGTLAPFREERDQAVPYPGIVERLELLKSNLRTHTAVISGRWSKDLIPLLGMAKPPEIWGCHGVERPDGSIVGVRPEVAVALSEAEIWAEQIGLTGYSERKPISLAFHWRGLPEGDTARIRNEVTAKWPLDEEQQGLILKEFDGGLELRPVGLDKGGAVKAILERTEKSDPVAYLGDDFTDEDAFEELGDRGLKVLVRKESRETKADLRLEPPKELLAFLDRWIASQQGEAGQAQGR